MFLAFSTARPAFFLWRIFPCFYRPRRGHEQKGIRQKGGLLRGIVFWSNFAVWCRKYGAFTVDTALLFMVHALFLASYSLYGAACKRRSVCGPC